MTDTTVEAPLRTIADVAAMPKHAKPSVEQRARIIVLFASAYQRGASMRDLAERSGRSFGYVHRVMTDAAAAGLVQLRGRGKAKRQPANT